jgi:hypothetical protein
MAGRCTGELCQGPFGRLTYPNSSGPLAVRRGRPPAVLQARVAAEIEAIQRS